MTRDDVVLVGVDGSAASLHALDWSAAQARAHGWGIRLVCSYSLPSFTAASLDGGYAALDDTAIQEGAKAVLAEATQRVSSRGVPVTAKVITGDAAGVLVDLSHSVRLAVVGTRGRGGFADRLLGTVSSALPAHAYCPTVVVPLREAGRTLPDDLPIPPPRPVKRIVVGVDGSPQAERALRYAIGEAKAWGAELTAVAGVPVGSMSGVLAWLPAAVDHEQVLRDVEEGLNVVVDRALVEHPDLTVRRIALDGTGAELLTEFSAATDLIVVGSRGRGGFAGLLLGSTSQAVLHHSDCPVMVVTNRCATAEDPAA
ncbi:universal stress protein [Cellulomonas fengjieae]|uniref:Universal stress protein n=1 Tax=Cellulomonas fengjieae TaxID=2819978 RepID=A0ABS3SNV1_9CELL|nr:universal stress protein [Cellulomonas fengjieae]MBO3086645.1 universal stress protein [Cellulomonas fengjieae]QVI66506.1 universal stress protein [Cellulomonas fengjieae]